MNTTIEATNVPISLYIKVKCSECDSELEAEYAEHTNYNTVYRELCIGPCEKCLKKAVDDAVEEAKALDEDLT